MCIVIAASFAEEMNRCRYMSTLLAQSLSSQGYGFLSVDAYGTGDSEGDFKDAGWEQTCQDLITGVSYACTLGIKKSHYWAYDWVPYRLYRLLQ